MTKSTEFDVDVYLTLAVAYPQGIPWNGKFFIPEMKDSLHYYYQKQKRDADILLSAELEIADNAFIPLKWVVDLLPYSTCREVFKNPTASVIRALLVAELSASQ